MSSALTAFAAVFPAELPDKTMFATIVLTTRYRRPLAVWVGSAAAFAMHVTIAVAAGGLLAKLPDRVVNVVVFFMFAAGSAFLLREALSGRDEEEHDLGATGDTSAKAAAPAAFAMIGLAELGDLTQLTTASLAARTGDPFGVALGAFAALLAVSGLAATFGSKLTERFSLDKLNYVGAAVFAGFALWTLLDII